MLLIFCETLFWIIKFINCGGKVQSTKRQSAGTTLRGRSWRHVNRLSPPEANIVWAAVPKTWRFPLIFIKQGAKTQKVYIDDILDPALLHMKEHFKNEDFTFQQDGTPSHTSKKNQAWCRYNFPRLWSTEFWPPSSPDLNPITVLIEK